jgi:hypothetical protein
MWFLMILTPVVGIPLACAVAVLKYRLYDIDRLISRTVSYAVVTGLLVGVYAGLELLASAVLRRHDSVTVAAAAGPACGGPPVQPVPVRRRADDHGIRDPASGRHRPRYRPGRPGRHRGPGP